MHVFDFLGTSTPVFDILYQFLRYAQKFTLLVLPMGVYNCLKNLYDFHKVIHIMIFISKTGLIGLEGRVFANDRRFQGSILGRGIPKTLKMVLDTSLLNTQQYKVCIKGKVVQSRERSSTLSYTLVQ